MANINPGIDAAINFNVSVAPQVPPPFYSAFINSCLKQRTQLTGNEKVMRDVLGHLMPPRSVGQLIQYLERGLDRGQADAMIGLQASQYAEGTADTRKMQSAAVVCGITLSNKDFDSGDILFRNLVDELKDLIRRLEESEFLRSPDAVLFSASALIRAGETDLARKILARVEVNDIAIGNLLFYADLGVKESMARGDDEAARRIRDIASHLAS